MVMESWRAARGIDIDQASEHQLGTGPLSTEHLRAIGEARLRSKKVRRAVGVAMFSGWTMAAFALVTALMVVFGDVTGLVLGVLLGAIAFNELRGAAMLRRFEARGARVLGWNQVGLGVLICAYSAWSLVSAINSPALAAMSGSTGDPDVDAMVGQITGLVTYGLYGTMFVVGVIVPGLTALYYFTRGRHVRAFVSRTPAWVVDAMRMVG
jgi:hypothetical protein